jgi:hypothetical protein
MGIAMKSHVFGLALLSGTAIVASAPAHAQFGSLTRSFVSSTGSDSNLCTVTQPCQTFAQAYTKIGTNGIIAALDPGKYGPLTISGPVTINGNGWAAITAPAQNNGITINAGSGNVILNGLEIDGAGAAYNGIVFNTGGSLTITNCTLQNFVSDGVDITTGNGILMRPTSGTFAFTITNTSASNNGLSGIEYFPQSGSPSANGVIDHVVATANDFGVSIDSAPGSLTILAISDTNVSNNDNGIYITQNGPAEVLIADSHVDNNYVDGVFVGGNVPATVVLRNVTINQTPMPIEMGGFSTIYLSQVTTVIASGFTNSGGITSSGTNNAVFSDGTSHLGSSNPTPQAWGLQ